MSRKLFLMILCLVLFVGCKSAVKGTSTGPGPAGQKGAGKTAVGEFSQDVEEFTLQLKGVLNRKDIVWLSRLFSDELIDQLRIGSGLKGKAISEMVISGFGIGSSIEEAKVDALNKMRELQGVLKSPLKQNE